MPSTPKSIQVPTAYLTELGRLDIKPVHPKAVPKTLDELAALPILERLGVTLVQQAAYQDIWSKLFLDNKENPTDDAKAKSEEAFTRLYNCQTYIKLYIEEYDRQFTHTREPSPVLPDEPFEEQSTPVLQPLPTARPSFAEIIHTEHLILAATQQLSQQSLEEDTNDDMAFKEIQLNKPAFFTGDRKKFGNFLREVENYLDVNETVYNSDRLKIAFYLSYMTGGDALSWKEMWLQQLPRNTQGKKDYGTLKQFLQDLEGSFQQIDEVQDALHSLGRLQQGNKTAEEHAIEFNRLVDQAGIGSAGEMVLCNYYMQSLNNLLRTKLLGLEIIPTKIKELITKAIRLDNNYRRMMTAMGRSSSSRAKNNGKGSSSKFRFRKRKSERDPNAMDVDRMRTENTSVDVDYVQTGSPNGQCFFCSRKGHRMNECRTYMAAREKAQKDSGTHTKPPTTNQKNVDRPKGRFTKGKDVHKHIRSLVAELEEEEYEEFMQTAEDEGF